MCSEPSFFLDLIRVPGFIFILVQEATVINFDMIETKRLNACHFDMEAPFANPSKIGFT